MTETTTTIPQETRPLRMDPDLTAAVEKLLEPYKGDELEAAQAAVVEVYHSSTSGVFRKLVEAYESAILEAVADVG